MSAIASQITSLTIVYSAVYSDADQKNIKAPRHWPLCGEFPAQMASNAENVSIWWRHHVCGLNNIATSLQTTYSAVLFKNGICFFFNFHYTTIPVMTQFPDE